MKVERPTNEVERLQIYFDDLAKTFPVPPKDWEKNAKPCRYRKILEERKNKPDVPTGQ
jgi:hypothetical protein